MFILKSLTNDDAQCICNVQVFDELKDAMEKMHEEYDSVRESYGIPSGKESVAETATIYDGNAERFAEVNSGINSYSWEILEFKNYIPRYGVRRMENSTDPDDIYRIWDNVLSKHCVDCNGSALAFPEKWQAQEFIDNYINKIFS